MANDDDYIDAANENEKDSSSHIYADSSKLEFIRRVKSALQITDVSTLPQNLANLKDNVILRNYQLQGVHWMISLFHNGRGYGGILGTLFIYCATFFLLTSHVCWMMKADEMGIFT